MVCLQKSEMKELFTNSIIIKNQLFHYGLKNMQRFVIQKNPLRVFN